MSVFNRNRSVRIVYTRIENILLFFRKFSIETAQEAQLIPVTAKVFKPMNGLAKDNWTLFSVSFVADFDSVYIDLFYCKSTASAIKTCYRI